MNTIEIFENGKTAFIPSSWSECTKKQSRQLFRLWYKCTRKGKSPLEFSVRALWLLLGVRKSFRGAFKPAAPKQGENVYLLCERLLGFLSKDDSAAVCYDSIFNPLPWARAFILPLNGPSDFLCDLTFGEFRHACAALEAFLANGKQEDLDECFACMYRLPFPIANAAGRMVPGMGSDIRVHKFIASAVPQWQKILSVQWLAACLDRLQKETVSIDGEDVELERLFSSDSGKVGGVKLGWTDLLFEAAKDGAFGGVSGVDSAPLYSILLMMWHNFKENKIYERSIRT